MSDERAVDELRNGDVMRSVSARHGPFRFRPDTSRTRRNELRLRDAWRKEKDYGDRVLGLRPRIHTYMEALA